jgi:putative phage-type endonuclease
MDLYIQYVISDFVDDLKINLHMLTLPEYQTKLKHKYIDFLNEWIESQPEIENDLDEDDILDSFNIHLAQYLKDNYVKPIEEGQIARLDNEDVPAQRSTEWYKYRRMRITASECGYLLNIDGKSSHLSTLFKKLGLYVEESSRVPAACLHGILLEDASVNIYETRYSVKIFEYGCMPHSKISYLAASPDGIVRNCKDDTNLEQISKIGRMIEIKNPYSRTITGKISNAYYSQMQLQMEVCDLHQCDFIETSLKTEVYKNMDDFLNDTLNFDNITEEEITKLPNINIPISNYASNSLEKGLLIYFFKEKENDWDRDSNLGVHYPIDIVYKKDTINEWIVKTTIEYKKKGYKYLQLLFWRLEQISIQTVNRDIDLWNNSMAPNFAKFWKDVTECKNLSDEDLVKRYANKLVIDKSIILNPMVKRQIRIINKSYKETLKIAKENDDFKNITSSLGSTVDKINSYQQQPTTSQDTNCKVININLNRPIYHLASPIIDDEQINIRNKIDKSTYKSTFNKKGNPSKKPIYYFGNEKL